MSTDDVLKKASNQAHDKLAFYRNCEQKNSIKTFVIHIRSYDEWKSPGYLFLVQGESDLDVSKNFIKNYWLDDNELNEELDEDIVEQIEEIKDINELEYWVSDYKQTYFTIIDTDPSVTKLFTGYSG